MRRFSPLDEELGLLQRPWTPSLQEGAVRLGTWLPLPAAAQLLAAFTRTALSEPTVRRQTEAAGAAYVARQMSIVGREWFIVNLDDATPPPAILPLQPRHRQLRRVPWLRSPRSSTSPIRPFI